MHTQWYVVLLSQHLEASILPNSDKPNYYNCKAIPDDLVIVRPQHNYCQL